MYADVLDRATPVRITFKSDFFDKLCRDWCNLSTVPETSTTTVLELKQREATQRARHAFEAGRAKEATQRAQPVVLRAQKVPTYTPLTSTAEQPALKDLVETPRQQEAFENLEQTDDWNLEEFDLEDKKPSKLRRWIRHAYCWTVNKLIWF